MFGGGGGAPQQSKKSKQLELMQMQALKQQMKAAKQKVEIPDFSMPETAPPPPPAAQTSADVTDAQQAAMRAAKKRTGYGSTIFAGETGGVRSNALGGSKTLLG